MDMHHEPKISTATTSRALPLDAHPQGRCRCRLGTEAKGDIGGRRPSQHAAVKIGTGSRPHHRRGDEPDSPSHHGLHVQSTT